MKTQAQKDQAAKQMRYEQLVKRGQVLTPNKLRDMRRRLYRVIMKENREDYFELESNVLKKRRRWDFWDEACREIPTTMTHQEAKLVVYARRFGLTEEQKSIKIPQGSLVW